MTTTPLDLQGLLRVPSSFEIVIGDFGRAAAVNYLRIALSRARSLICNILSRANLPFFDEYRRMMFCLVADIGFFKAELINKVVAHHGKLNEDVLIGLGAQLSLDVVERVGLCVLQQVEAAVSRGYQRLNVTLPCNGLAPLAEAVSQLLRSPVEVDRIKRKYGWHLDGALLPLNQINVCTVPATVVDQLTKTVQRPKPALLILGTQGVNKLYAALGAARDLAVYPLSVEQYRIIDRAIVAAIGGKAHELETCRQLLTQHVIKPAMERQPKLVVVEACTDFDFGLGYSSLEILAEAMVLRAYTSSLGSGEAL